MLHYMGENDLARRLEMTIDFTLSNKEQCTADLGGKAGTKAFTENIIRNLQMNAVHLAVSH
jgi:isocitrate dehydrogenase (NAD+)